MSREKHVRTPPLPLSYHVLSVNRFPPYRVKTSINLRLNLDSADGTVLPPQSVTIECGLGKSVKTI